MLTGCFYKGVKVGDIKFKAPEICSKEYAITYLNIIEHPTLGCLPPQRFQYVEDFNFTLQRPPISLKESNKISDVAKKIELNKESTDDAKSNSNLAPTFIGRIIEFNPVKDKKLPESGNFTYPTIKDFKVVEIPTAVLLSTQVSANEDVKKQLSAKLNAGELVNGYLTTQYAQPPEKLKNALKDVVLKYESETDIQRLSLGKFQYVTIEEDFLDETIQILQNRCLIENDKTETSCDPTSLTDLRFIDPKVGNYVNAIENLVTENKKRRDKAAFALIIGASILNTSGDTNSCEIGSLAAGTNSKDQSVTPCSELAKLIKLKLEEVNLDPSRFGIDAQSQANAIENSKNQVSENIASAFFSRKKATLKTLKLNDHASVLAIHYILIQPGQVK